MKKKIILIFLLTVFLVGGVTLYLNRKTDQNSESITLYGNVDTRQVSLGFRVSGRVAKILFDEGDRIQAGDVVAILDQEPYTVKLALGQAQLAAAEAQLLKLRNGFRKEEINQTKAAEKEALASLKNAEIQHSRNEALLKEAVIPQKEADITLAARDEAAATLERIRAELELQTAGYRVEEIAAAEAEVASATASVAAQELDLRDCSLVAQESGVVQIRSKEPGAMVTAGTGIITETLDKPVWIRTYIPEPLLGKIRIGMKVDIYNDSQPGQPVGQGQIGFISPIAEFTPKTVETATLRTDLVYRIRVTVQEGTEKLLQGMPVTIRIIKQEH